MQKFGKFGKCVLTGGCAIAAYSAMVWAFAMMNRPSDLSLYTGLAIVLALVVLLPLAVRAIWRRV